MSVVAAALLLALGAPSAAAFWRRGRPELACAVLPIAGALSLVLPLVLAAWVPAALGGWVWQSGLASLGIGGAVFAALGDAEAPARTPPVSRGVVLASAAMLVAGAAYALWAGAVLSRGWPGFGWDGLAIWLVRAEVLAGSEVFPTELFRDADLRQSHWDYPLLLPAWLAWFERVGALPVQRLSIALGLAAALFPAATALGLLRHLPAPVAAAVGLAPFAVPELLEYHFRGYADPLLVMIGLAGLTWGAAGAIRWDRASLVASGLALAAVVAVKNEGFLWLCATGVGLLLLSTHHGLTPRRWIAGLAAALLPGLLLFGAWRITCAHLEVEGTLLSGLRWDLVTARLPTVVAALGSHVFTPELAPLLVAGVAAMLLLAGGPLGDRLLVTGVLLAAPVVFLAGLFTIYVATPHELSWHIQTSLHRTVYPVAPAVVALAAFAGLLSRALRARTD